MSVAYFYVDETPGGCYFKVKQVPQNEDTWCAYKVTGLGWGYSEVKLISVDEGVEKIPRSAYLVVLHKKHRTEKMKVLYEDGDYIMYSPNGEFTRVIKQI